MNFKVGIANHDLEVIYGEKGSLDKIKELGADSVDLFINGQSYTRESSIYSKSDEEIVAYYKGLREYADSIGLMIYQTHGRMRIYMADPERNATCLENARRDLLATAALGVKQCVMHGVTTSEMGADADPQTMRDMNYELFSQILVWAKQYNVRVATETFGFCSKLDVPEFYANAKEFKAIYDRITADGDNKDYFKVCVDTGHTNSTARYDGVKVGDFIRMMGDAVVCLHMHDNDGFSDQHRFPYMGTIDWEDTLNALDEIGYKGVYNLELSLRKFGGDECAADAAGFGIKVMRNLLSKHFAEK